MLYLFLYFFSFLLFCLSVSLQEELESINDVIRINCKKLKILYLQNNIIPKMQNLRGIYPYIHVYMRAITYMVELSPLLSFMTSYLHAYLFTRLSTLVMNVIIYNLNLDTMEEEISFHVLLTFFFLLFIYFFLYVMYMV